MESSKRYKRGDCHQQASTPRSEPGRLSRDNEHRVKWTRSEVQNGGHGSCAPEAHLQGAS